MASNAVPYTVPGPSHLHAAYSHSTLQSWSSEGASHLPRTSLVWPLFLLDDPAARQPIASLPGQCRWGVSRLPEALDEPVSRGLSAVLLFGVVEDASRKDARGSAADAPGSSVLLACAALRERYPRAE